MFKALPEWKRLQTTESWCVLGHALTELFTGSSTLVAPALAVY